MICLYTLYIIHYTYALIYDNVYYLIYIQFSVTGICLIKNIKLYIMTLYRLYAMKVKFIIYFFLSKLLFFVIILYMIQIMLKLFDFILYYVVSSYISTI